ncbi:divalent-cation tolerance protein CutA [Nocardia sp. NPDC059239]|uniref:divalent-cation tolerance protein CutA n=1 Tax=Nocardia sp. NPDC059239 TaxID=3346785 RepID=UPI0036BF6DD2
MGQDEELVTVSIAGPDEETLAQFVRHLVENQLAACGNIVTEARSIYRWEDAVSDEGEALVWIHTRRSLVGRIVEAADQYHPYEVPQVLAFPVVEAHPGYREWVLNSTSALT